MAKTHLVGSRRPLALKRRLSLEELGFVAVELGRFKPELDQDEAITHESLSGLFKFRHDCHHLSPLQVYLAAFVPEILSPPFCEMRKPGKGCKNS
jgi:hypothetical protein